MKSNLVNPASISDAEVMNYKSQAQMASLMQKIGKGKRKNEYKLTKRSQQFLEQLCNELKKQMSTYASKMPNIISFFDYVIKTLHVEKKKKRPKEKSLFLSYEELDFLKMQLKHSIKGMEGEIAKLKWYNFLKRKLYKTMVKQTEILLLELK